MNKTKSEINVIKKMFLRCPLVLFLMNLIVVPISNSVYNKSVQNLVDFFFDFVDYSQCRPIHML